MIFKVHFPFVYKNMYFFFFKNLWNFLDKALLGMKMKLSLRFYIHIEEWTATITAVFLESSQVQPTLETDKQDSKHPQLYNLRSNAYNPNKEKLPIRTAVCPSRSDASHFRR